MNAPKKLALILSAIALALPQTSSAQSAALSKAWAGTWYLDTAKSKFSSTEFTPKSDTRTYSVAGKHLTMRSTGINAAGKAMTWSYSANTDHIGVSFVGPREFKSRMTLKGKPSAKSTATVSADGKVLTINRSILTAKGGPTNDVMVFDRTK